MRLYVRGSISLGPLARRWRTVEDFLQSVFHRNVSGHLVLVNNINQQCNENCQTKPINHPQEESIGWFHVYVWACHGCLSFSLLCIVLITDLLHSFEMTFNIIF